MPVELAHDSYKYIIHETADREKVEKYATRMLVSLSLLDFDLLAEREPTLAALGLWHRSLALVRLEGKSEVQELRDTLERYQIVRPMSKLSESKLPTAERLKERLVAIAEDLGLEENVAAVRHLQLTASRLNNGSSQAVGKDFQA